MAHGWLETHAYQQAGQSQKSKAEGLSMALSGTTSRVWQVDKGFYNSYFTEK